MVDGATVALALEAATVAALAWTALRVGAATRLAGDPRLARLTAFFALWALAALVHGAAAWEWSRRGAVLDEGGFGLQDVAFWSHHAFMVAALALAAMAYGPVRKAPSKAAAVAPVLLVAEPVLRIAQALGFVYLLVLTLRNHLRRSSLGSMAVALAYFLVVLGQGLLLIDQLGQPAPLGPRSPWAEGLILAGAALLAWTAPTRRGRPG